MKLSCVKEKSVVTSGCIATALEYQLFISYKPLEESPDPFRCYLCMHLKHIIAVVEECDKQPNC